MHSTESSEAFEADINLRTKRAHVGDMLCIEWLELPATCVVCGDKVGRGPVGWRKRPDPGPVCDRCLIHRQIDFGLLLWITHILREIGRMAREVDDPAFQQEAMAELLSVAKIYDLAAGKRWPGRAADVMAVVRPNRRTPENN